jgi:hypothetical protein
LRTFLLTIVVAAGVGAGAAIAVMQTMARPAEEVRIVESPPRVVVVRDERQGVGGRDLEDDGATVSPEVAHANEPAGTRPSVVEGDSLEEAAEIERNVVGPFEAQPRNGSGAAPIERRFAAQFEAFTTSHPEVPVTLDSVECRALGCRVDLRYPDETSAVALQDALRSQGVFDLNCTLHSLGFEEDGSETTQGLIYVCPSAERLRAGLVE